MDHSFFLCLVITCVLEIIKAQTCMIPAIQETDLVLSHMAYLIICC